MSAISYYDDNGIMSQAFLLRDDGIIDSLIVEKKDEFDYIDEWKDSIFCYSCRENKVLSELYGFKCLVVRFAFSRVERLHLEEQEKVMLSMCEQLTNRLRAQNAYINIRIPTHIVDLTRAFNQCFNQEGLYFCGGTVEEIQTRGSDLWDKVNPDVKLFFADKSYCEAKGTELVSLAREAFKSYMGQYHISPVTAPLAGTIYENWIEETIAKAQEDTILVAELNEEVAGFYTILHEADIDDGLLTAVSSRHRKHNVYKSMLIYLMDHAERQGRHFVSSTQLDNFVAQRTWAALGMRPIYSIYNFHYDRRYTTD